MGLVVGATIGCSVVLSAILAFCMAANPDLIQTGLLAKIANVGTFEQILKAIATYSVGGGTILGSGVTVGTFASKGLYSSMKNDKKELKEQKNNKRKDWMGIFGK